MSSFFSSYEYFKLRYTSYMGPSHSTKFWYDLTLGYISQLAHPIDLLLNSEIVN